MQLEGMAQSAVTTRDGQFAIELAEVPDEIDLRVFDPQGFPIGEIGPLAANARFRRQTLRVSPRVVQLLNRELTKEIVAFLKRPEVLKRVTKMLTTEGGNPEELYAALVKSDPFGISPFTFRTTICCLLYQLYDAFKQTSIASSLVFNGGRYLHLWTETVVADVLGPASKGSFVDDGVEGRTEIDEDWNFKVSPTQLPLQSLYLKIQNSGRLSTSELNDLGQTLFANPQSDFYGRLHCEIIPCDQVGALRRFMSRLQNEASVQGAKQRAGQPFKTPQVRLTGTLTIDPRHLGFDAHLELHPIKDAQPLNF